MLQGLALLLILVAAMSLAFLFPTERAETPTSECSASSIGDPSHVPASIQLEDLADNFVRAFHFNTRALYFNSGMNSWTYFDPESGGELDCFIPGKLYWILVKEPQEVILNNQHRNLTCTSRGNCWNLIMW